MEELWIFPVRYANVYRRVYYRKNDDIQGKWCIYIHNHGDRLYAQLYMAMSQNLGTLGVQRNSWEMDVLSPKYM